jgi:hypothetical protein
MFFINAASAQGDLKANELKATKSHTTFNVLSLDGKYRIIKIIPDYVNHVLTITCLHDTIRINDYWGVPPDIHLLNRNFIEINYEVRGGSNLGLGNILILCVKDGKLYEALYALRYSDWNSGDRKTKYMIRPTLNRDGKNNYRLNVQIHDDAYSKRNPQENFDYNNQTTLSFDAKLNVFYNIKENINDNFVMTSIGKKVKQKIGGSFPVIILGKESYYYLNNKWYQFGKSNEIYQFQ